MDEGEVKRRIEAARILRDMTQVEMDRRGAQMGLDKQELGRTERGGNGGLELTEARAMVLCKVLGVPSRWFEEEDLDVVLGLRDQPERDALDLLQQLLVDLGLVPDPSQEEEREGEDDTDLGGTGEGGGDA